MGSNGSENPYADISLSRTSDTVITMNRADAIDSIHEFWLKIEVDGYDGFEKFSN